MARKDINQNEPPRKVTTARFLGMSSDWRTNRWEITCPHCLKTFCPPTTMFNHQSFSCPSCLGESYVDYKEFPCGGKYEYSRYANS